MNLRLHAVLDLRYSVRMMGDMQLNSGQDLICAKYSRIGWIGNRCIECDVMKVQDAKQIMRQ